MTNPDFLSNEFDREVILKKIKDLVKAGFNLKFLDDEFFDDIENRYINPLIGPICQNYHMILNFKELNINNVDYLELELRRCFRIINPTEKDIPLFPDEKLVWSRYIIDESNKGFIDCVKNEKINPYSLESIKIDDQDCLEEILENLDEKYDWENNTINTSLPCSKLIKPYIHYNKFKKLDYVEKYSYPYDVDYCLWMFKFLIKDFTIIINYPSKNWDVSAYITKSTPDGRGRFAKKLNGKKGQKAIITDQIFYPGATLWVHWKPLNKKKTNFTSN